MKKGHKTIIVLALSLVAVLALGVGLASAQSQDEEATPDDAALADGEGPMGPGGPGGMHGPRPDRELMRGGEVVSVDGDTITINNPRDEQIAIKVNDETVYLNQDGDASLADVVPGEFIGVKLVAVPEEGQDAMAEAVHIGKPDRLRHRPTVGEVTAVDGNNVTISNDDGEQQFTLPSIEVGQRLGVGADEDGNVKGVIYDPPERPLAGPDGPPDQE